MSSFPPLTGPLERMTGIPGSPPDLSDPPSGCRFHLRCPHCLRDESELVRRCRSACGRLLKPVADEHLVACHLVGSAA